MQKIAALLLTLCIWTSYSYAATGEYYGSVAINSPTGMGNIDLAFHLEINDLTGAIDPALSYVILEKTVLFPKTGQIGGKDVGPMVQTGHLTATNFYLEIQAVPGTISQKAVSRKLILDGAPQTADGNTIIGTYTETVSGYMKENIIISGDFILSRPVSVSVETLTMDLQGVIKVLQLCAGMNISIDKEADKNGNGKIDIAEAVYALQVVARIRQP
jgi:hypothetical protein